MNLPTTEATQETYRGIDRWPSAQILSAIVAAQVQAVAAVEAAVPVLALAGDAVAERMRRGGRLIYAGAGSSGLMAQVDALELPGTYGISADRVPVLLAGGDAALLEIPSEAEDDGEAATAAVIGLAVGPLDTLIALSASGRTPYAVAALTAAKARGALTIGVACNGQTPLLEAADHAVLLATPPEVVAGSTRMNAGTAQKCALNMLSTLIGIRLGHVYDGLMVNLQADNLKLKGRAVRIVAQACAIDEARAGDLLARAEGEIKTAIVLNGLADGTPADARARLAQHAGDIRAALAR
ncbi:N-acetylmuramic acid 6-phosphate etherase [Elstera sp.]|jgi:N-acetylmuramic acid 6-phosphate etherase|uniref:N-acetylmuramic acid 6-phosphate etherase n=1 Tax=Elstera sp. TaxID=1916664 RepID=UPI0037BF1308